MIKISVELLLDVEDDDASCYDAINAILSEQQRAYSAQSCLIDYKIIASPKQYDLNPNGYIEGQAWTTP